MRAVSIICGVLWVGSIVASVAFMADPPKAAPKAPPAPTAPTLASELVAWGVVDCVSGQNYYGVNVHSERVSICEPRDPTLHHIVAVYQENSRLGIGEAVFMRYDSKVGRWVIFSKAEAWGVFMGPPPRPADIEPLFDEDRKI